MLIARATRSPSQIHKFMGLTARSSNTQQTTLTHMRHTNFIFLWSLINKIGVSCRHWHLIGIGLHKYNRRPRQFRELDLGGKLDDLSEIHMDFSFTHEIAR